MHVLLTTEEQSLKSFIDLSKDHSHMAMFVNAKLLTIKTTRCFHHKVIKVEAKIALIVAEEEIS